MIEKTAMLKQFNLFRYTESSLLQCGREGRAGVPPLPHTHTHLSNILNIFWGQIILKKEPCLLQIKKVCTNKLWTISLVVTASCTWYLLLPKSKYAVLRKISRCVCYLSKIMDKILETCYLSKIMDKIL